MQQPKNLSKSQTRWEGITRKNDGVYIIVDVSNKRGIIVTKVCVVFMGIYKMYHF